MKLLTKISLCCLFIGFCLTGRGQNLVPNPSFEDTTACPWTNDKIHYAIGWFKPSAGSSDLLHSCSFQVPQNLFGYQNARTGYAYAGFYTYHTFYPDSSYREYISIRLKDSLQQGKKYNIEFYASRSDSSNYATILGAYLSSDSLFSNSANNLPYIPQLEETGAVTEKSLWVKLSYEYIAAGGEKYLTIGNFRDDSLSDTINTSDGGDVGNPDYLSAYYYIDDISITEEDTITGINDFSIGENVSIYPNPITDYFQINQAYTDPYDLTIYNSLGQQLYEEKNITTNSKTINSTLFTKGLLIINIKSSNQFINYKLLKQ
ncbi:MAG: T9SS type A sorting domain-containing protein [Flavobacteriales bacterium]|nr:T9SS type A sorting domain-containing protein [Flavobacteriales bacterium]